MPFAIDVACDILSRPTEFDKCLLQVSALTWMHDDGGLVNARTEQWRYLLTPQDFFQHRFIKGLQHQAVHRMVIDLQAPIT